MLKLTSPPPPPLPLPTLDGVSTLTLSREGFRKKMVTQMIQQCYLQNCGSVDQSVIVKSENWQFKPNEMLDQVLEHPQVKMVTMESKITNASKVTLVTMHYFDIFQGKPDCLCLALPVKNIFQCHPGMMKNFRFD